MLSPLNRENLLRKTCLVSLSLAGMLITSCDGRSPWDEIEDKDNYCLVRRNEDGEIVLSEHVVAGEKDGYYRLNHVSPYLDNIEGWYDRGIKVGRWRAWYMNGTLKYEEQYAPTASVTRIGHMDVRREILMGSCDYDSTGVLVGVSTNGMGIRVCTFEGTPPVRSSFSTMGFPTNYFVGYDSGQGATDCGSERRIREVEVSVPLPDGGETIRKRIRWVSGTGRLSEVFEQPTSSPATQRYVCFDSDGNISQRRGDRPEFLEGVPFVVPELQSNKLVFCERIAFKDGETSFQRLPEDKCKVIELW